MEIARRDEDLRPVDPFSMNSLFDRELGHLTQTLAQETSK
jgi:hypothetical protein